MAERFCIDFRHFAPLPSTLDGIFADRSYASAYGLTKSADYVADAATLSGSLDAAGVSHAVLVPGAARNEELAEYIAGSERLFGIGGLDDAVREGRDLRAEAKRCREIGLLLCGLAPYQHGAGANDALFYPAYEGCSEAGIGVVLHSSFHLNRNHPIRYSSPIHLDDVARDFPDMPIVASHGGWPWIEDMIAVAWRHPNVFIEISGQRNRYVAEKNSGWDMLFHYLDGPLRNKAIWGSTWPFLPLERQKLELDLFPVKAEVKERMLGDNPRRVLQACGAVFPGVVD